MLSRISKERVESCPGIVSKEFQLHLDEINLTYLDNVCDSQQKDICCVSSTFLSLFFHNFCLYLYDCYWKT